ncbi:hypothetical protein [Kocuria marina]|uniref:hypothetical protein n=1 Tax=Kocuria marina TaxID=223184 RepID=UPI0011A2A60F|nr:MULTISPECIES: hypothetical protein [Kocuria]MCT2020844.1 hypothetical protein [Kocuria marina]
MSRPERLNARPLFWPGHFTVSALVIAGLGQLLSRGIITLPWLVGIAVLVTAGGVLLAQFVVLPRLTRRPSPYPRIASTDTWESSLTREEALERIRETLTHPDTEVSSDGTMVSARIGNDLTFRHRGTASDDGRRALPLAATFQVEARDGGSRIHGEARDDFGWDFGPPQKFIEDEVRTRATALLRRARSATG